MPWIYPFEENKALVNLKTFAYVCPFCGACVDLVASGYDKEYDCDYDQYICTNSKCKKTCKIDTDEDKILIPRSHDDNNDDLLSSFYL